MSNIKYIKKIENNDNLTYFEKRVLKTILSIPKGEVRSYSWVAGKMGSKAYRAVGSALAKNPYAPDVPCHRVIGLDGALGGYSGGVEKKARLLKNEGVKI